MGYKNARPSAEPHRTLRSRGPAEAGWECSWWVGSKSETCQAIYRRTQPIGGHASARAFASFPTGPCVSRTRHDMARATVKVRSQSHQMREQELGLQLVVRRLAAKPMADKELAHALATRIAVEEAMHRGRCGTDADSRAAPRPDPRARRRAPAHRRRSREITTCRRPSNGDVKW